MVELVAVANLNQTAQIHSADSLGDVLYRAKVMSDKEVRDISLSLILILDGTHLENVILMAIIYLCLLPLIPSMIYPFSLC